MYTEKGILEQLDDLHQHKEVVHTHRNDIDTLHNRHKSYLKLVKKSHRQLMVQEKQLHHSRRKAFNKKKHDLLVDVEKKIWDTIKLFHTVASLRVK